MWKRKVEAEPEDEDDKWERPMTNKVTQEVHEGFENPQGPMVRNKNPQQTPDDRDQEELSETWNEAANARYPVSERRKPNHLRDFVTADNEIHTKIDYCYRAVCGVPCTFKEAMESAHSKQWVEAMDEDIQSLKKTSHPDC